MPEGPAGGGGCLRARQEESRPLSDAHCLGLASAVAELMTTRCLPGRAQGSHSPAQSRCLCVRSGRASSPVRVAPRSWEGCLATDGSGPTARERSCGLEKDPVGFTLGAQIQSRRGDWTLQLVIFMGGGLSPGALGRGPGLLRPESVQLTAVGLTVSLRTVRTYFKQSLYFIFRALLPLPVSLPRAAHLGSASPGSGDLLGPRPGQAILSGDRLLQIKEAPAFPGARGSAVIHDAGPRPGCPQATGA